MRRESDRSHGERTGQGRRARDRLLSGDVHSPSVAGRADLENHVLLLADDIRESAIALGGIESFLADSLRLLERPELTAHDLRGLVEDPDVEHRIELLWDALGSLRRSMGAIHAVLTRSDEKSCYRGRAAAPQDH